METTPTYVSNKSSTIGRRYTTSWVGKGVRQDGLRQPEKTIETSTVSGNVLYNKYLMTFMSIPSYSSSW